jgi:C-terminal processing protease CtpA/Prc
MKKTALLLTWISLLLITGIACKAVTEITSDTDTPPFSPPTPLLPSPVQPGKSNPNEPVFVSGDIPYTSPFFLNTITAPFVLLEDQAGFIQRDKEFEFSLLGQAIGPVEIQEDQSLTYSLALPSVPQGTMTDLDNDEINDAGVQVFAVGYWSNTWGGPFLEERDGSGWSNAYVSTRTDPENDNEIIGGTLIVWAPDSDQGFPTGFGEDGLLFTADDPVGSLPAGYSIVNLDQAPFEISKQPMPEINLIEGDVAVNNYSELSYTEAFEALFEKVSREYPFTQEKGLDWDRIYQQISPQIVQADNKEDFYLALREFAFSIPDAHVSISFDAQIFYEERGGGFGLILKELSDGRIIVSEVLNGGAADQAGILPGAEIVRWDGKPIAEAVSAQVPNFGPYSTDHHKRLEQVSFLTRVPPNSRVEVEYIAPGGTNAEQVELDAEVEYDSLFNSIPPLSEDEISLPVTSEILDDTGIGYIKINTFSDDYSLLASSWEHIIKDVLDNEVPALILDLRNNSGGSGSLAMDFAGYFFDEEIPLYDGYYYDEDSGEFEADKVPTKITPAPILYEGPIAVLVSPYCVSACEGFAYALSQEGRATIIGNFPTSGAFGEVGRGQYDMPEDISMQFPTGRPQTPSAELLIEGTGVIPDTTVPVTQEDVLSNADSVLQTAIDQLLNDIGR